MQASQERKRKISSMLGIAANPKPISTILAKMRRSYGAAVKLAADVLLPPQCAFCEEELNPGQINSSQEKTGNGVSTAEYHPCGEILLCSDCRRLLESPEWQWCRRCGSTRTPYFPQGNCCYRCQKVSLSFDAVVPLGLYRDEMRDAVLRMKRRSHDHLSATMARLYIKHRGPQLLAHQPDVAVPVPMHRTREFMRGTNSASILADEIAQNLGIPSFPRLLVRKRKTKPQKDLPPIERMQNVRDAFRLAAGYDIRDARVLLVDDIMTTGATCRETAKVLKRSGAKSVVVAVLARAESRGSS